MNLPQDFILRMKEMLGAEYEAFANSFENSNSHSGIRINTRKENAQKIMKKITQELEGVKWCRDGFYCDKSYFSGNHPYHIAGLCYFQEPSAMSAVEALDIKPDDFVLDLCSAPGGKATQAGAKLSESGLLVANEIIPRRAVILAENIERCGISNSIITNESPEKLTSKFLEFFDKIIVDAPCSGEGMFKKEPQAVEEWSINHTKTCSVRQTHIMDCAYKMLRPGGMIVYSTCTFAPAENEGIVDYMLSTYSDITLADTGLDMLSKGIGKWVKSDFDLSLTRRIFPHTQKGEGHFVALFKKQGEAQKRNITKQQEDKTALEGIRFFREFEKKALNTKLSGCFKMFGDNLYLVPHGIDTNKLKLVRGGLHLGICKKNRFEPSHALALSLTLSDFKNSINFAADDEILKKYLHGEAINGDISGYCAVCVDNVPLGWAKGSSGILKNHFPKFLRLL